MSPRVMVPLVALNVMVIICAAVLFLWKTPNSDSLPAEDGAKKQSGMVDLSKYQFLNVEKIYVNLRGRQREHYLVIDLSVQVGTDLGKKELQNYDPVVSNSVVSRLSEMSYEAMRSLTVPTLQLLLEEALREHIVERNLKASFESLLISRMLAQ